MNFKEWSEQTGVEPECDSCVHCTYRYIDRKTVITCQLKKDGIECDGESEFISDGR